MVGDIFDICLTRYSILDDNFSIVDIYDLVLEPHHIAIHLWKKLSIAKPFMFIGHSDEVSAGVFATIATPT